MKESNLMERREAIQRNAPKIVQAIREILELPEQGLDTGQGA